MDQTEAEIEAMISTNIYGVINGLKVRERKGPFASPCAHAAVSLLLAHALTATTPCMDVGL